MSVPDCTWLNFSYLCITFLISPCTWQVPELYLACLDCFTWFFFFQTLHWLGPLLSSIFWTSFIKLLFPLCLVACCVYACCFYAKNNLVLVHATFCILVRFHVPSSNFVFVLCNFTFYTSASAKLLFTKTWHSLPQIFMLCMSWFDN